MISAYIPEPTKTGSYTLSYLETIPDTESFAGSFSCHTVYFL